MTRSVLVLSLMFSMIAPASAAQASIWKTGGAEIAAGTNPNVTIEKLAGNANYVLKTTAPLTVTCTESKSVGTQIRGGNPGGIAGSIELKQCSVVPAECEVQKRGGNAKEIGSITLTPSLLYEYQRVVNGAFGPIVSMVISSSEFEFIKAAGQNNACGLTANNPYKLLGDELVEVNPEAIEQATLIFAFQATKTVYRLRPGGCFTATVLTLKYGVDMSEVAMLTGESTVTPEVAKNFGAYLR